MSHAVRTPMNGVVGLSERRLDTNLDDEQRADAGSVSRAAGAPRAIGNDILDFPTLAAGRWTIDPAVPNTAAAVEDGAELLRLRPVETEAICDSDRARLLARGAPSGSRRCRWPSVPGICRCRRPRHRGGT